MMTTAGSLALEGHVAAADAPIVKQLRDAGAVLLGKTNLSEWANFRSTRSSSGWSSRGGQTKNPYVLDRSPCGSSAGSGTAVAANLCAIAIGTETNGSISCPSSINGIVGIKPTVGLWSRTGIIPISHTQDTAGPMARTVRDAAILLGALTAEDSLDKVTQNRSADIPRDYTVFLKTDALDVKIIGVDKSLLKGHEAIDLLLAKALEQMKVAGATIVEVEFRDQLKDMGKDEFDVLKYEFKDGLNKYLATHTGKVKSLGEVIKFNEENESRAMPYFKQEILIDSDGLEDLNSKGYKDALDRLLTTTRKAFADVFSKHNLNALCGPTNGPSWCIDLINGDSFTGYGMYSPAAIAGYPSITVPMGAVASLPVGLSFLGMAYTEPELLGIAFAYEQVSKNRKPPEYVASVGASGGSKN
jgi:amidase